MNVATLARAWFDHHDFSTLPPSGDGSYDSQRPLQLYSLNGIGVKREILFCGSSLLYFFQLALHRLEDLGVSSGLGIQHKLL